MLQNRLVYEIYNRQLKKRGKMCETCGFRHEARRRGLTTMDCRLLLRGNLEYQANHCREALRGAQPVIMTDKMPLILQYDGHQQTIVGCEQSRNGMINLLTFDPSRYAIEWRIKLPHVFAGKHEQTSPSKVLRQVLHPVQTIKSGKRKANDPSGSSVSPAKRVRAATGAPGPNDDVIVIDDDDDEGQNTTKQATDNAKLALEALDFRDVLGLFRLDAKNSGGKTSIRFCTSHWMTRSQIPSGWKDASLRYPTDLYIRHMAPHYTIMF
ncbi:hypothetical protein A0H81_04470 [Grifola frondosa]|uniref:Uncharacterized protein n=1 Tax=Grifola frondosa TaxID=5627 RepID=A0A1C7MFR0_GRIFR|nr:hypothetical protein A0H81_04470 [Grifola frondosa]